jgi:hypothetical protein
MGLLEELDSLAVVSHLQLERRHADARVVPAKYVNVQPATFEATTPAVAPAAISVAAVIGWVARIE